MKIYVTDFRTENNIHCPLPITYSDFEDCILLREVIPPGILTVSDQRAVVSAQSVPVAETMLGVLGAVGGIEK